MEAHFSGCGVSSWVPWSLYSDLVMQLPVHKMPGSCQNYVRKWWISCLAWSLFELKMGWIVHVQQFKCRCPTSWANENNKDAWKCEHNETIFLSVSTRKMQRFLDCLPVLLYEFWMRYGIPFLQGDGGKDMVSMWFPNSLFLLYRLLESIPKMLLFLHQWSQFSFMTLCQQTKHLLLVSF